MRRYEMMVILDPQLDERTVAPSLDQFLSVVKTQGGRIEKVDVWGKRRLSYEINKHTEGIYAVLDMSCTPPRLRRPNGNSSSANRFRLTRTCGGDTRRADLGGETVNKGIGKL